MNSYLMDVSDDKVFYLGDKRIKNLYELLFEIRTISEETYGYYACEDHNYFSDWIEFVIKNKELAEALRKTKTQKQTADVLEKRLDSMKEDKKQAEPLINLIKPEIKSIPPKSVFSTEKLIGTNEPEKLLPEQKPARVTEAEAELHEKAKNKQEAKEYLWKHFSWEMAKEFMYGMAIGILIGLVLSKIFIR